MTTSRRGAPPLLAGAVLALATGCARPANNMAIAQDPVVQRLATGHDDRVARDLARVRAATAAFRDLDAAVAAGYPREVTQCIAHPEHGTMGYHHVKRSIVDSVVEVEQPEILVYERLSDGRYRLNGVEYIIPLRRWSRSEPPTVMGQAMKREEQLQIWYLHVWAWTENPAGLFADWNPAVACPA
jgi:hypothetical protein